MSKIGKINIWQQPGLKDGNQRELARNLTEQYAFFYHRYFVS